MRGRGWTSVAALFCLVALLGCSKPSPQAESKPKPALPPEPAVSFQPSDAKAGEKIAHGELLATPDAERQKLHAQHHPHKVVEIRKVPGSTTAPAMDAVENFALSKKDLEVINPGPGE